MEKKIIYYDKLFPIYDNKNILNKLKIDIESVSYISSPIYAEKITKIITNHIKNNNITITDCTAGCGGDTISFLNTFKKVNSIEKNVLRFNYLFNNIKKYNLQRKAKLYCGNFQNIIKNIPDHDVIYFDPPWGGKDYKKEKLLKLKIDNIHIEDIIIDFITDNETQKIPELFVFKLPLNYDIKFFYKKLEKYSKIFMYKLNKMLIIVIVVEVKHLLH